MGIEIKNLGLMGCRCGRGIQEKLIGIAWREARGEEERKRGRWRQGTRNLRAVDVERNTWSI
jgi:hypothetical protein